jgi:AcrR family transcriptional regulator
MSIRQERRAALREKLIEIADEKIGVDGLNSVTARYLSGEAGCALGAIYNMFDDMNELFMAVNLRSFTALGAQVKSGLAPLDNPTPHDELNAMAQQYISYAMENTRHWLAMFEIEMTADSNAPVHYQQALDSLLQIIAASMARVYPEKSDEQVAMITRTVFSSIHGIVLLGVQRRLSGVPEEELREMVRFLIFELGDA